MVKAGLLALSAVILFALGTSVEADEGGKAGDDESDLGVFTVQWENDTLSRTDRHYTNGIRLSWVSPKLKEQMPWAEDALRWLYPFDPGAKARIGVAVGQSIFTPGDIAAYELIEDDRPYAGWLYLGLSLHVDAKQKVFGTDVDFLDTLQLNVGIVGESSLAEQTQKFVHEAIKVQSPNGWEHQLDNEPGFALILERKWRTPALEFVGLEADAIPNLAVSIGNVDTSAGAGALIRFGDSLSVDYGPPNISSNLTGREFFDRVPGNFAWYLFAGASGRFVGRNIFLDGNTFGDSHSVNKNYLVGDLQAGAAVVYQNWRLAFTYLIRSREFEHQDEADRFGALNLSVRF
ncbi:MAG: lipid A deacylase LpxR family protein [Rhodospirillales bacterium]|nr:lipid A deacylase LpxR family protein [Rhodospirillales bacterium]